MALSLADQALQYITKQCSVLEPGTQQLKYCDVPSFLSGTFDTQEKVDAHAARLQGFERDLLDLLKADVAARSLAYDADVPADPRAAEGSTHYLRLWQIAFAEKLSMKGASPAHAVRECMRVFLTKGCRTDKIPIEVLFKLSSGARVGQRIGHFQIAISNGFAVTSACHLLCLAALELDWAHKGLLDTKSASLLLKCIRLKATYEPQLDMKMQVHATLSNKNLASSRLRPSTLQMLTLPEAY